MTQQELYHSPEYWEGLWQVCLYNMVATYMRDNDVSLEEIANRSNVSINRMKHLMRGDANLKLHELIRLAIVCNVKPDYSFKEELDTL